MFAILRRVLVLVTIVAFAAGMTIQATPSAAAPDPNGRYGYARNFGSDGS